MVLELMFLRSMEFFMLTHWFKLPYCFISVVLNYTSNVQKMEIWKMRDIYNKCSNANQVKYTFIICNVIIINHMSRPP